MRSRSEKYRYKIVNYKSDIPKPRRGEIVIIPRDNRLLDIPPYLASSKLPYWWADLPKSKMSLRRCQGTYDFISAGIIIPLWSDIIIRPDIHKSNFDVALNNYGDSFRFYAESFKSSNTVGCPMTMGNKIPTGSHPKIVSPYRYYTPKGVSMLSLPVYHDPNPNYSIMPGIVHTDFYNQIHIVINVLTDKEFTIPAGTPIQHLIPFHRGFDFKRIVWGNESMAKFTEGTGMGLGSLSVPDDSHLYRRLQKKNDLEIEEELQKSAVSKFKDIFKF